MRATGARRNYNEITRILDEARDLVYNIPHNSKPNVWPLPRGMVKAKYYLLTGELMSSAEADSLIRSASAARRPVARQGAGGCYAACHRPTTCHPSQVSRGDAHAQGATAVSVERADERGVSGFPP